MVRQNTTMVRKTRSYCDNRLFPYSSVVVLAAVTMGITAGAMAADEGGTTNPLTLQAIDVTATGVSSMDAASTGDVTHEELQEQPYSRPGAILENVPGLIVTQHSGEGKANQYFLRGFNLDHGTDLATEVDNMPINMPTHAHGQGYTDLNFLIPELVGDLHYKKGPYYADEGDFATAGAVRMGLLNEVDDTATIGFGEDGYRRALLMGSTKMKSGILTSAGEVYHNDGPWQNSDDYNRLNGVLRYFKGSDQDYFTVTAMAYHGAWNSTDQGPQSAIDDGLISRFGTLAPTDGGQSSRSSLSFNRVNQTESGTTAFSAYVIKYKLDLWSTFVYDLTASDLGTLGDTQDNQDQMLQHDNRTVYGFKGSKSWFASFGSLQMTNLVGVQARVDDIADVGIDATIERQLNPNASDAVNGVKADASVMESNGAVYAENNTRWNDVVRTVLGLREDAFTFDTKDKMLNSSDQCVYNPNLTPGGGDPLGCDSGAKKATMFSPKLGIILGPWARTAYFINVAEGYHSNDARGVTRSGEDPDVQPATPLTRAKAAEVGIRSIPLPGWETSVDAFLLKLKSELVFSGDAGDTSPSGATTRTGVELGNRFHFNNWLSGDVNASFTRARFDSPTPPDDLGCGDADGTGHACLTTPAYVGRYIPNSPTTVVDAGLSMVRPSGWFGSVRARYYGETPLVEDDSIKSSPYTTFDMGFGYQKVKDWKVAIDVFNITDKKWNDITYYYAVRLPGQANAAPDYVVHSGIPRTVRAEFTYYL